MQKLNTILVTLILLLSITVHAAPVVNNNVVAQGDKVEGEHRVKVFFVIGMVLTPGGMGFFMNQERVEERKQKAKIKKQRQRKKTLRKRALRKRAEVEYAHRHMHHR
jgi:uncharacterized membrane protein YciS (DUF1049 family)